MKSTPEFDAELKPYPKAAQFVCQQIDSAVANSDWLKDFQARLLAETGTRLLDWTDHIFVDSTAAMHSTMVDTGFVREAEGPAFGHPQAMFPRLIVSESEVTSPLLGVKVENVEDFLSVHADDIDSSVVNGEAGDQLRIAQVTFHDGSRVHFVERHGYRGFVPGNHDEMLDEVASEALLSKTLEAFRKRDRSYGDPKASFVDIMTKFGRAAAAIGRNRACDLFFQTEREFWQLKNTAAKIQYDRQQALGLGWANHDHHTYRCSRECFAPLIHFLETAGFHCRERFYAGKDAGWGAQVLEHPECGIVIFADVDMSEDELAGDFAHEGLKPKAELGTVGLWCKLHGDSFLAAGMHHLECQFDFDAAREQFAAAGVETMKPFTDFPHLKQAFTAGEKWKVPSVRLQTLVDLGVISGDEAQRFEANGVIGSHFEILERNDGYKGFNQTGISKIILQTNPKKSV